MLQFSRTLQVIDSHTAGEPTRVVTAGLPPVAGASMADKRTQLARSHDDIRRALVLEPRGHDAIVLACLLPPCRPEAQLGVVFANDAGYLGMCGHGAIGVATVAVATGLVPAIAPLTDVVLDTPAGLVTCKVTVSNGKPEQVAITNVPAFLFQQRVVVPVHGFGKVAADIAYGGNWFAFVEADQLGLAVEREQLAELMAAAHEVRRSLQSEGVLGRHPNGAVDEIIDHVKLFETIDDDPLAARALTLCPGTAYDRSPCGTGTSAKLAVLHAKGEIETGQWFRSQSVLGTEFRARVVETTQVGATPAVVPEIVGAAWITALSTMVIDPDDPCAFGL